MSILRRLGLEEMLEVDKLHHAKELAQANPEYDSLYEQTKKNLEDKAKQDNGDSSDGGFGDDTSDAGDQPDENQDTTDQPTEDPPPEEEPASEDPPADDTEAKPEDPPKEEKPKQEDPPKEEEDSSAALEAIVNNHMVGIAALLGQERVVMEGEYVDRALSALGDGAIYLKDLGVEYGPIALKHVFKGVLYAMERIAKAMVEGARFLYKYIDTRMKSYKSFKERIKGVQSLLESVKASKEKETAENQESKAPMLFENEAVLRSLSISGNTDFLANVQVTEAFMKDYFGDLGKKVQTNIRTTFHLIDSVMKAHVSNPEQYMYDDVTFKGLTSKTIGEYKVESEYCDSLVYQKVLPGDVAFMAFVPKKGLRDSRQVKDAYSNSKMFLGFVGDMESEVKPAPIATLEQVEQYLNVLNEICDVGLSHAVLFGTIQKQRKSLEQTLESYFNFLTSSKEKISIRDSLVEYVSLKSAFLDRTYITGAVAIQDFVVRILTHSLSYCKDSIRKNS